MVYIFCALYPEAAPWISAFRLKKVPEQTKFQTFTDGKEVCLVITGIGKVAAATAVGSICTANGVDKSDVLVNIGICAKLSEGTEPKEQGKAPGEERGSIYLCNKLLDEAAGKTFFPDVLVKHPFPEGSLLTGDHIYLKSDGKKDIVAELYDMEAAGIYQAGVYFFGPEQMVFLKVVSDFGVEAGEPESGNSKGEESHAKESGKEKPQHDLHKEKITALLEQHKKEIITFLKNLKEAMEEDVPEKKEAAAEKEYMEKLYIDLCCSETMRHSLKQLYQYAKKAGLPFEEKIGKLYEQGKLPCMVRREGTKRIEELKEWTLE